MVVDERAFRQLAIRPTITCIQGSLAATKSVLLISLFYFCLGFPDLRLIYLRYLLVYTTLLPVYTTLLQQLPHYSCMEELSTH